MKNSSNTTLLALMIALSNLDTPLNDDEKDILSEISEEFSVDTDDWDSIQPSLMEIIESNSELNTLFLNAKSQLLALGDSLPDDFFPKKNELAELQKSSEEGKTRGGLPITDDSDFEDDFQGINNMTIDILSQTNPQEVAKKSTFVDRIKQHLQLEL